MIYLILFAVATNFIMIVANFAFIKIGSLPVMDKLRNMDNAASIGFFTDCHHTPYYSFIHRNISMDFPDCSPENRAKNSTES